MPEWKLKIPDPIARALRREAAAEGVPGGGRAVALAAIVAHVEARRADRERLLPASWSEARILEAVAHRTRGGERVEVPAEELLALGIDAEALAALVARGALVADARPLRAVGPRRRKKLPALPDGRLVASVALPAPDLAPQLRRPFAEVDPEPTGPAAWFEGGDAWHAVGKGRRRCVVEVAALDRAWRADDPTFYVGPGGVTEHEQRGKYEAALELVHQLGDERAKLDPPIVGTAGGVGFTDGRHRFAALRDLGARRITVATDDPKGLRARLAAR